MINASNLFKQKFDDGEKLLAKAIITLADNTVITVRESDIISLEVQEQTCSGTFDIGTVSQSMLTLSLISDENDYTIYNFVDATVVLYFGIETSADTVEWIQKGVYTVDMPLYKEYIELECYDNVYKLDKQIASLSGSTAGAIVGTICTACGITFANANFKNYDLSIILPDNVTDYTYRQILAYICQITCNYAKCTPAGQLKLSWYDTEFEGVVDGGEFDTTTHSTYQSGDSIDGGNFTNYSSGDSVDGGTFDDRSGYWHLFKFMSRPEIATDETIITGVRVTQDEDTYLYGQDGYVIEISDNPLVSSCQAIANLIGPDIVGIVLRGFSGDVISNPLYEAGDKVIVSYRSYSYYTVLTNNTYKYNSGSAVSCNVESKLKNQSGADPVTQIIQKETKKVSKKLSAYEVAMSQITTLMSNSFGVHNTEEIQDDGSTIYYMHDKPTLEESTIIWKQTATTFTVSDDRGETWKSGWDASGNAVMNILSAIGINADWINAGQVSGEHLDFLGGKIGNLTIDLNGLIHNDPNTPFSNFYIDTGDVKLEFTALGLKITSAIDFNGQTDLRKTELTMDYNGTSLVAYGNYDNNGNPQANARYDITYGSGEAPEIRMYTAQNGQPTQKIFVNGLDLVGSINNTSDLLGRVAYIEAIMNINH